MGPGVCALLRQGGRLLEKPHLSSSFLILNRTCRLTTSSTRALISQTLCRHRPSARQDLGAGGSQQWVKQTCSLPSGVYVLTGAGGCSNGDMTSRQSKNTLFFVTASTSFPIKSSPRTCNMKAKTKDVSGAGPLKEFISSSSTFQKH